MAYQSAYHLKLYRNFKAIDSSDYHGMVRYYERFEEGIRALEAEEYFDCTLAYANALFETGRYGQHVVMCDHLLELVIMQNIDSWGGEDIYARLLFRKSAALFQMEQYRQSEYVVRALIRLHPQEKPPRRLLRACLLCQKPAWLRKTRTATLVLAFFAVAAIAVELFVIRPFYLEYYRQALLVHNLLLGAAATVLAGGEFLHFWRCHRAVQKFAKKRPAAPGGT